MPPYLLQISRLNRRFRGVEALDSLTFDFAPGRINGVVGESGSGKSTLMRILAGLDHPNSGSVELDGAPITRTSVARRGFGIVQQPDQLFGHLTLAENVALPLRLRRIKRTERERLVQDALETVQITDAAGLHPSEAGPDQIARALIARATVFGPRVLLLDEPFGEDGGLAQAGLVSILRRIHGLLGATTVLATRHAAPALALCDQIIVLRDGVREQAGPPDEIFRRPRNTYVASMFGEINRLEGVVEALEPDTVTVRLACGPVVEAARGGVGLETEKPCVLLLRPETIAIAPVPAREMGEGAIDARMLEAQYWGDSYRLRLLIGSGVELVVIRPALAGLRGLKPGRDAAIAWQPHNALAFRSADN
jgi:ABC-type Fe3+/spermidine/putrescine transport system ATPase subunit